MNGMNYLNARKSDITGLVQQGADAKGNNLGLTSEMMKNIQQPGSLHLKLLQNILDSTAVVFDNQGQGYLNSKDIQIQCLFEYEKLRMRSTRKQKRINEAQVFASNKNDPAKV